MQAVALELAQLRFKPASPDERLWVTALAGDGRQLPLYARLTDAFVQLRVSPLTTVAQPPVEADLARRLLLLNDELPVAKFSLDKEHRVNFSLDLPHTSADKAQLFSAVSLIARTVKRYDRELRLLAEGPRQELPGLAKPKKQTARRTVVLDTDAVRRALSPEVTAPERRFEPAEQRFKQAWSYDTGAALSGVPYVHSDRVLFASADGSVLALSLKRGSKKWRFPTDETPSSPVAAGKQYFCTAGKAVLSGDIRSGRRLWRYSLASGARFGTASFHGGAVLVGASDGKVYCIDAERGAVAWTFQAQAAIQSAPIVHEGLVYAVAQDGHFYVIDFPSGTERARFMISTGIASLGFAAPFIYAAAEGNRLLACDLQERRQTWEVPTDDDVKSPIPPCITGELVMFNTGRSTDNRLYAVERSSGKLLWTAPTGLWGQAPTLAPNGQLCISCDRWIHALDGAGGTAQASAELGEAVTTSLGMLDTRVFVGTESGKVICLQ